MNNEHTVYEGYISPKGTEKDGSKQKTNYAARSSSGGILLLSICNANCSMERMKYINH